VLVVLSRLRTVGKSILIHLCITLATALTIFAAAADRTEDPSVCTAVAVLLHLTLLMAFCWMLMEGLDIRQL